MSKMVIQKNVGDWNFEFLSESIFIRRRTSKTLKKKHEQPKRVIYLSIKFHDISSVAQLNSQDSKFSIRFQKF